MATPGIAQLSGQPTLTNPLNQQDVLEGRSTRTQQSSEARKTVMVQELPATQLKTAQIINQVEEARETNPSANKNPGSNIDIIV